MPATSVNALRRIGMSVALMGCAFGATSASQDGRGEIYGRVTEQGSAARIPGVTVTVDGRG